METEYHIDWTTVGKKYTQNKKRIQDIISRLEWETDWRGKEYPMMQGFAIQKAMKEFNLPRVSAISWSCNEMAPYGFYGIEANYKNAKVRAFFVDEGSALVPVCIYVWNVQLEKVA